LGALVAPAAPPLHERMAKEGRLVSEGSEVAAMPWSTNIVPRQLTREQLLDGIKWLCNKLYHPSAFGERVVRFIDKLGKRRDPQHADGRGYSRTSNFRPVDLAGLDLLSKLERFGPHEREMCSRISKQILKKPEAGEFVAVMLLQYMQIRYMYEQGQFWESYLN